MNKIDIFKKKQDTPPIWVKLREFGYESLYSNTVCEGISSWALNLTERLPPDEELLAPVNKKFWLKKKFKSTIYYLVLSSFAWMF